MYYNNKKKVNIMKSKLNKFGLSLAVLFAVALIYTWTFLESLYITWISPRKILRLWLYSTVPVVCQIEGVRDLIRQHIILSDRNEQLAPLNLNKGKAITDGIGCLIGNIGSCANPLLLF
jgi:hypothetical protein